MFRAFGLALLIIAVIGSVLWGFNRHETVLDIQQELASTHQELSSTQQELSSTQQDLNSTQAELTSAQQELESVEQELDSAELTISSLESELELYKDTWGSVRDTAGSRLFGLANDETARNPTWAELLDFLVEDNTDENPYVYGAYVCRDFAVDVHNNAEQGGIRAAYVSIDLSGSEVGHALNAFKTTDRGLVFIDCTGLQASEPGPSNCDKTVDVRLGKRYVPKSLFPESGWSVTWESMGTVRDVEIYW
jgi:hypothetical protein